MVRRNDRAAAALEAAPEAGSTRNIGAKTKGSPVLHAAQLPLYKPAAVPVSSEKRGAVYTRGWVVELILDLAGYQVDNDLAAGLAVEPAAGDGAFLIEMARRLVRSCVRRRRPFADCKAALLALELDERAAARTRAAVIATIVMEGVPAREAEVLAQRWVRAGDYLLEAPRLPRAMFVIGNPPYIRTEDLGDEVERHYRDLYPTMRGRADIYVGFFEAALRQLCDGGVCAFICADRWLTNQYGSELRRFIAEGYNVETVVEMHDADAFEADVDAYPAVTVIRRAAQGAVVVARVDSAATDAGAQTANAIMSAGRDEGPSPGRGVSAARLDHWFKGTDPWPCVSPQRVALLKRLEAAFQPLESAETGTRVGIGVATGLDAVFITKDPNLVEQARMLPLAMVADTLSGHLTWSGHYLVNPWDRDGLVSLDKFPRLREYFEAHRAALSKRHTAAGRPDAWFRTIDRVRTGLVEQPKLLFPDIKAAIHPVLDTGNTYPHHNLYFVESEVWDLEVLGALLLSAVGQFFVECYGVRMRGGWLRFQAQYLRRIRVPRPSEISSEQSARLVRAFRGRDVAAATAVALEIYEIKDGDIEPDYQRRNRSKQRS